MTLKASAIAFAALFIGQSALAQDHLEPEDSIFTRWYDVEQDRYETIVVSKLKEAFGGHYHAQAIVIPSFEPEYAIALYYRDETFKVLYLKPETHLFLYEVLRDYEAGRITSRDMDGNDTTAKNVEELREKLRVPLDDVKLERCEASLDRATGAQLLTLWEHTLGQTRYPEKSRLGFDGVTYHFSGNFSRNQMAGKVWRPNDGTPMAKLVAIVGKLRDACLAKDGAGFDDVRARAEALCEEIGCTAK